MANPNPVTAWKPGQSGNANGRPPDDNSWAGLMRKVGAEVIKSGITKKEACVRVAYNEAAKGNDKFLKMLIERMEGLLTQSVDVTTKTISIKPAPEPEETLAETIAIEVAQEEAAE